MTITDEMMSQLREAAQKATPGPWRMCETAIHGVSYGGHWVEPADEEQLIQLSGSGGARSYTRRIIDTQCHDDNEANAAYIALANPATILALLDERRRLSFALDVERAILEKACTERDALRAERDALALANAALTATALYKRAEAAEADAARLRKALEPFAEMADILDVQAEGDRFCWGGNEQKQPIHVWLGPTDFGTARAALTTKGTAE